MTIDAVALAAEDTGSVRAFSSPFVRKSPVFQFWSHYATCVRLDVSIFRGVVLAEAVSAPGTTTPFRTAFVAAMAQVDLVPAKEAARRLGITVTTLYDWLGQSDHGLLVIRGEAVAIRYFQSGARGQGKIQIEAEEIDRIRELMRVSPVRAAPRRRNANARHLPGITVPLGRPTH